MASRAGRILGEVGAIILMAYTLYGIQMTMYFQSWPPSDWRLLLSIILTLVWGAGIIIGVVLAARDIKVGNYLILAFGSIALVGTFIPLHVYRFPPMFFNIIPLSMTFFYVDVLLVLVGGILAVVTGGRD
ncbi:MAG: hypothetical protein ACFE8E_13845 [Candidatus Hodarchaeota archaeon]